MKHRAGNKGKCEDVVAAVNGCANYLPPGTGCRLANSSSDGLTSASSSVKRTMTASRLTCPQSPSEDHFCGVGPRRPSTQTKYHSVMAAPLSPGQHEDAT